MISTRQYRVGISREHVEAILREGAGQHWHPDAVNLLLAEVVHHGHANADELAPLLATPESSLQEHEFSGRAAPCVCDSIELGAFDLT